MLSILIPVYNYDVRGLVLALVEQINLVDTPIEINLLNDGSDTKWQSQLNELVLIHEVSIHNFKNNRGRVSARRKLAELAIYDNLLFIDCDAEVVSDGYITNYLNILDKSSVVVGGHIYQSEPPDPQYRLHWKYGNEIEVRTVRLRQQYPYRSFSTFNFCIPKQVFNNYLINIEVEGYGHEDTLMGHILNKSNVPITHIDNPLLHAGLKEAIKFLEDTESALHNAVAISDIYPDIDIKVIRYAKRIKAYGMRSLVIGLMGLLDNRIMISLNSDNPSLKVLQLYKLKQTLSLIPNT